MTGEAIDLVALKRLARDAGGKVCWTAVETGRPEFRNVSHYIYDGPTMLAETNGDLPHIAAFMAATAPATILSLAALIEAQAAEIEGLRKALERINTTSGPASGHTCRAISRQALQPFTTQEGPNP